MMHIIYNVKIHDICSHSFLDGVMGKQCAFLLTELALLFLKNKRNPLLKVKKYLSWKMITYFILKMRHTRVSQ
jgi:hypothetical protein